MAEQGAQYRQRQHEKEEQKRLINEMLAERPFMCLKCGRSKYLTHSRNCQNFMNDC